MPFRPATLLVNGLTLLNALFGFAAMAVLIFGHAHLSGPDRVALAAGLILAGYVPDILDGLVARALNASSKLGAQLDVYADTMSFNVATALLILCTPFAMTGEDPVARPGMAVAAFAGAGLYLCAGLVRSSRLVVVEEPKTKTGRYFLGLTTNLASFTTGALVFLGHQYGDVIPMAVRAWAPAVMAVPLSALMVSKVLYPDVPGHLLKGLMPRWPYLLLLPLGYFAGPALAWALAVLGWLVWPVLMELLGRRPE